MLLSIVGIVLRIVRVVRLVVSTTACCNPFYIGRSKRADSEADWGFVTRVLSCIVSYLLSIVVIRRVVSTIRSVL